MYHVRIDNKDLNLTTVNFGIDEVKWMGIFSVIHGVLGITFFLMFSPFEAEDKLSSFLVFPGLVYDAPLVIIAGLGIFNLKEWARKFTVYFSFGLLVLIVLSACW